MPYGIHHAVVVYGTTTCTDTTRSIALLNRLDVAYNFYDTDKDDAMRRTAMALQNGASKVPVIDLHDGVVLIEPSDEALEAALRDTGRL